MFGGDLQRNTTAFIESVVFSASRTVSNSGADFGSCRGPCRLRPRKRLVDVCSMSRRARRGVMRMSLNGDDDSSGHSANPNDRQSNDGESEDARNDKQDETKDEDEDAAPVTPSSTEVLFNQEILRRRMSALNSRRSIEKSSDGVLDLSLVEDRNHIGEVSEETMTDEEASKFIDSFDNLSRVWVILFTNVSDGSEGVYSLAIGGQNIVLAFQERQEAHRYAICLEAQKFPQPQICDLDPKEIREFCVESDFKLGFIPTGMIITPPDDSVIEDLDKWSGKPTRGSGGSTDMSDEDIDAMRKRFDTLFGQ